MNTPATTPLFHSHSRKFEDNRYVYPVLSRRAGGLSIGVNLNLDKVCNFHCVYCQVNRGEPSEKEFVELPRLRQELDDMLELVTSGSIWKETPFERHARAAPPLERHRPERRRRTDHVRQFRRRRRRLRGGAAAAPARRPETRADHQREHVRSPGGPAGVGDLRRQRRRDLGEARRRHGGVLSKDRPVENPLQQDSCKSAPGRPRAADRHSVALHASLRGAASAGRAGGLLRPA